MDSDDSSNTPVHPLTRQGDEEPVQLQTGYYGARGERIQHTVHKGALYLPKEALDLMKAQPSTQTYDLPSLDAVQRPLAESSTKIVTELKAVVVQIPTPPGLPPAPPRNALKTVATNRTIERLRGGGGDDEEAMEVEPTASDVVPSSSTAANETPATTTTKEEPNVQPLPKQPNPQWKQHKPGPADEMGVDPAPPQPDWFRENEVTDLERSLLPEWFDQSADHRTPSSYLQARNQILQMATELANRYLTVAMVRRTIPGDMGSLMRLHAFLESHALINQVAQNDSAPLPQHCPPRRSMDFRRKLVELVVAAKRQKVSSDDDDPLDWKALAVQMGGITEEECEREFLLLPFAKQPSRVGVEDAVTKSDPAVIHAAIEAACRSKRDPTEIQQAAMSGVLAAQALQDAQQHEDSVANILKEILDVRLQKLENRMALMDDLEGLLEAERVALELERRDLYTSRCRHWFHGK